MMGISELLTALFFIVGYVITIKLTIDLFQYLLKQFKKLLRHDTNK